MKIELYYCEHCEVYFTEYSITQIQPDVGVFHADCMKEDFRDIGEIELLEILNNK